MTVSLRICGINFNWNSWVLSQNLKLSRQNCVLFFILGLFLKEKKNRKIHVNAVKFKVKQIYGELNAIQLTNGR